MWVLLLPLPSLFTGVLAAGLRRRGGSGCVFIGGFFIWPEAQLLKALGISSGMAWLISIAVMIACPILGYLLGLRLFPLRNGPELPDSEP